ncbi:MAG: SpoIID/LytB domain-containing protein [Defluviitaleaceae bacterium]|nr:SpoIID/LytB domain-containing protein [Defluviitaleaceae bacterium]
MIKKFLLANLLFVFALAVSPPRLTRGSTLPLGQCLYQIVSIEMSRDFHEEALKAQAVAARTYLMWRYGIDFSDLCDQTNCSHMSQSGSRIYEAAIKAVNDTRGQLLTYDGKVINSTYFSSSGGATDDSENVWVETLPYLRSVDDPYEVEPRVWTRTFSFAEIDSLLAANGAEIGETTGVSITRKSASGRVQELTVYGTGGEKALVKEEIRTFFQKSPGGSLESRNFTILGGEEVSAGFESVSVTDGSETLEISANYVYGLSHDGTIYLLHGLTVFDGRYIVTYGELFEEPVAVAGDGVTFSGRGWGHGVGLSQKGAEGYARNGYGYVEILKHYYTGVSVG